MRAFVIVAALGLITAPAAGRAQPAAAPTQDQPVTQGPGRQAGQDFGNAGNSATDAARSAWHGLKHGWTATTEGARRGWNAATKGGGDPQPADPHPAR